MANLPPVRMCISPKERELLEAAAEESHTNLSDFIRGEAVEAAEIELVHQNRVVIPAADWKKFEAWVNSPPKDILALANLAKARPVWRD